MGRQCVVEKCWPILGRRLLRFPRERALQLLWIKNLNLPHLLHMTESELRGRKRICDRHFRPEDVIPPNYPGANNRALRPGALPIAVPVQQEEVAAVLQDVSDISPVPEVGVLSLAEVSEVVLPGDFELASTAQSQILTMPDTTDQHCNSVLRENSNLIISHESIKYHIPIKEENDRSNSPPSSENWQINENAENHFFSSSENEIFIKTNTADTDDTEISLPCEDLQAKHEEQLDDELFLTCVTHALNTMCPNDKLELKMRVLEVIKDIKRK